MGRGLRGCRVGDLRASSLPGGPVQAARVSTTITALHGANLLFRAGPKHFRGKPSVALAFAFSTFPARLINTTRSGVRGWREGCGRGWRTEWLLAGREGQQSSRCDRPDRLSGHKTLLYLVTASHGGPGSGCRGGPCDTTYNSSCVWKPLALLHDRS